MNSTLKAIVGAVKHCGATWLDTRNDPRCEAFRADGKPCNDRADIESLGRKVCQPHYALDIMRVAGLF